MNFEKNGIFVIVPMAFYSHTEFEIDTSFFGQVIAKNCSKLMTSNFQTQFLAILDVVAQNKDRHWPPRDELNRINIHFMQNYQF